MIDLGIFFEKPLSQDGYIERYTDRFTVDMMNIDKQLIPSFCLHKKGSKIYRVSQKNPLRILKTYWMIFPFHLSFHLSIYLSIKVSAKYLPE